MFEIIFGSILLVLIILFILYIVTGINKIKCPSCKYAIYKGYYKPELYCRRNHIYIYIDEDFICNSYVSRNKKYKLS